MAGHRRPGRCRAARRRAKLPGVVPPGEPLAGNLTETGGRKNFVAPPRRARRLKFAPDNVLFAMSSVQQIESAVAKLSREELSAFRNWFADFDAEAWDRQLESDVVAGRLDALGDEAVRDLDEGRCSDL